MTAPLLIKGRYQVQRVQDARLMAACLRLRADVFRAGRDDQDAYDARCDHFAVVDPAKDQVVCCFRVMHLANGTQVGDSYAAQFYDLTRLHTYGGRMAELGRFCIAADGTDPDILRVAWGGLTKVVDDMGIAMLFGCSSFAGTAPGAYRDALALLARRHTAPAHLRPGCTSPDVVPLQDLPHLDAKRAMASLPPLLRTYLLMGGWVSDHAVIDADLGTLHVFTGLEIAAIPETRKRLLRAMSSPA